MSRDQSGRVAARGLRGLASTAAALLLLARCGGGAGEAPAHQQPTVTFTKTVRLKPVSGKVLVDVPASSGFVLLAAQRVVAVGTVVNATSGVVSLTSAGAGPAQLHTGVFHGGIFEISQPRAEHGLTVLTIRDNLTRTACTTPLSPRILGLLRGKASGNFQTVGRFSAATVRGTEWGVRNRCDGTLTVVQEGMVVVNDFRLHRSVTLHTGQTYLAKS